MFTLLLVGILFTLVLSGLRGAKVVSGASISFYACEFCS